MIPSLDRNRNVDTENYKINEIKENDTIKDISRSKSHA